MRAPPFARIPAVAAPRPDAEPVTITHKPSLDIRFLLSFEPQSRVALYHTARRNAKLHCAELQHAGMPAPQGDPTSMLVRGVAFPHHALQRRAKFQTGNAVSESENIVVETAEKIFADLADAQDVNRDKTGAWKTPLWQALSEAGLPLSWVAEEFGGSGASPAEGFGVLSAAGRFAISVPLAETMLAGWLLAQAKVNSPEGAMTVAPASPKDRITLHPDGTLSGR